jgi:hypothetical protein
LEWRDGEWRDEKQSPANKEMASLSGDEVLRNGVMEDRKNEKCKQIMPG